MARARARTILMEYGYSEKKAELRACSVEMKKIVIVLGTTGAGKSTIINMMFNEDYNKDACSQPLPIGNTADSVTKNEAWRFNPKDGRLYIDTIGFGDPSRPDFCVAKEIKDFIRNTNSGVHCILIVVRFGRLSTEERFNLHAIEALFDKRWAHVSCLVATHYDGDVGDAAEKREVDKWLGEDDEMKEFMTRIGNRIILTDNSLGRHEVANRPLRKRCLERMNQFVNECDSLVGPAPKNLTDMVLEFLEIYFNFFQQRVNKKELKISCGTLVQKK